MFAGADTDKNFAMSDEEFKAFAEVSDFDERELQYIKDNFTKNAPGYEIAALGIKGLKAGIAKDEAAINKADAETAKLQLENITELQKAEDANNGILSGALVQSHGYNRRGGFRLPPDDDKDSSAITWNKIARDTIETGSAKGSVGNFKSNTVNMVLGVMRNTELGNQPDFTKEQALEMLNAENPGAAVNKYRDKFYNSRLQPREVEKLTEVIEDYWNPMNGKSSAQAQERKATNDAIDAQRRKDSDGTGDSDKDTATNALPDESSADFAKGRAEYNRILEAYNASTDDVKAKLDENEEYKALQEKYGDAEKADATFNSIVAREKESEPGSASSIASGIMSGKTASEAEAKVLRDSLFDAIKNFSWTPKESKSQKAKLAELEPAGQAEFKISMDKAIAEFGPKPDMSAIQKKNSEERIEKHWKNQIQTLKRKQDRETRSANAGIQKPDKNKYLEGQENLIDEFGKHETVEERMAKTKELKSLSKEEISKREATKTDNLVADKNSSITREDAKALETKYNKLAKSKGDPVFNLLMETISSSTDDVAAEKLWKDEKFKAQMHEVKITSMAEVKQFIEFTRRVKETDLMNWREVNAGKFTGVDRIDEALMQGKTKELSDADLERLARSGITM
ncbi:MAG: hypothetical protein HOG49_14300, partial [Candidatus Scalindua sp.]|nr:hypothetical protein [Candidatus Scalindua sp.]